MDFKDDASKLRIEWWRQVHLPCTGYVLQLVRHEVEFQAVSRLDYQELMICLI